MLTFYNHRGIRVTGEWIAVDGHRYPVRDLEDLRLTRGPLNRPALWGLGTGGSLLGMTVVMGPVLPALMLVGLGSVGVALVAAAALALRLRPRERLLWASFAGEEQLLLATSDSIEVGKLYRALRRAVEREARFQRVNRTLQAA